MGLGMSNVISYVLIFIITLSLIGTAYSYIAPKISITRKESEFDYMVVQMKNLDDRIKDVSRSGEGAKDYLSFTLREGTLIISNPYDEVTYIILNKQCFQKRENIGGLYFEYEISGEYCENKILINYTEINITNNVSFSGLFDLWIENIGYSNKPLLKVG